MVGAVFNASTDRYDPIYGGVNTAAQRRCSTSWICASTSAGSTRAGCSNLYLDIQNVYNRANPEAPHYNYNFRQIQAAAGLADPDHPRHPGGVLAMQRFVNMVVAAAVAAGVLRAAAPAARADAPQAIVLELPRHRQGYYLAIGNHALVTQTWDEGRDLGTWVGTGLSIRMGQMMTKRFGLGLQIDFGGSAKGPEKASVTGLSMAAQWELLHNFAVHGGVGLGVIQLTDDRDPDAGLRGAVGTGYFLGLSYDWFPLKRRLTGGFAVTPMAQARLIPAATSTAPGVPVRRRPDVVDGPAQQPARSAARRSVQEAAAVMRRAGAGAGVVLLLATGLACRDRAASAPPPVTVANSEVHVLPRSANGRQYQLMVQTPGGYAAHPELHYPVIYVLDGYWDFQLFASIAGGLVYDKAMPEAIIVGIGYPDQGGKAPDYGKMRAYDLTPVPDSRLESAQQGDSGHGREFLDAIDHEIIPFVEARYRADATYRVLAGSSLGGLFALYVLFTRPALFAAYITPSPAVSYEKQWLYGPEDRLAKSKKQITARLYMTATSEEPPWYVDPIKELDRLLRQRAYPGLAYEFRIIDGERHAGTKPESYNRGVRFAFAPRVPPRRLSIDAGRP